MEDDFYDGRRAMRVQLARLFGSGSKLASSDPKTAAQWKKTLTAVLDELEQYLAANVDTDEFHRLIVAGGLAGAREALKQEDFWPGYVEGITRLAFLLLGDYPDHKRRKKGRKDQDHYKLDHFRSLTLEPVTRAAVPYPFSSRRGRLSRVVGRSHGPAAQVSRAVRPEPDTRGFSGVV